MTEKQKQCGNCKRTLEGTNLQCTNCREPLDLDDGYICDHTGINEDHYCSEGCLLEHLESDGLCTDTYPEEKYQ